MRSRNNPFVGTPGTAGVHAIVYHGSHMPPEEFTRALAEGFQFRGAGGLYGYGLYTVFREDADSRTFTGVYGPFVYRIAVPVRDYIVFEYDVAVQVYGPNPPTIAGQIKRLGLYKPDYLEKYVVVGGSWRALLAAQSTNIKKTTSDIAMEWFRRFLKTLDSGEPAQFPNGLIFRGKQDGDVCVVFNPDNIAVLGYKQVKRGVRADPSVPFTPLRAQGKEWRTKLKAPPSARVVLGNFDITREKAIYALLNYLTPGRTDKERNKLGGALRARVRGLGVYRDAFTIADEDRNTYYALAYPWDDKYEPPQIYMVGRKAGSEDRFGRLQWDGDIFVYTAPGLRILPVEEAGYMLEARAGLPEFASDEHRPSIGYREKEYDYDEIAQEEVTHDTFRAAYVPVVTPQDPRDPHVARGWDPDLPPLTVRNPASGKFTLRDLDASEIELLAKAFQESYTEATGAAWSRGTFLSRARSWTFYGDVSPARTGVVAIRHQRSGMNKLVAVAGNPRAVLAGIKELMADKQSEPVWGAVSADLVPLCSRFGLIPIHEKTGGVTALKAVAALIPADVFGGNTVTVLPNGALRIHVIEIGPVEKYFVANKAYFAQLAEHDDLPIPTPVKWILRRIVAAIV